MAVVKMNVTRNASLRLINGLDGEGREKYITRTVANFKTDSSIDDVYEVVYLLASLGTKTVKNINMNERCELVE